MPERPPEPAAPHRDALLVRLAGGPARRGFRIAMDLLGDAAEAEDAVQEALVRTGDRWQRVRDPGAIDAFYLRVVTSLCLRALRRRRVWRFVRGLWPGGGDVDPPSREPPADEALARARQTAALTRALDRLPAQQRAALVLRYGHDFAVAEVAALLGVGVASAKTHLVRGLSRLRQLLEDVR